MALTRVFEEYGVPGVGLKWPNDVLWDDKKLAGVLVDVHGEATGPSLIVLGVGVNGYIGSHDAAQIDQPWTDLHTITGKPVDRNRLAALVLRELRHMFEVFADKGLAAFRDAVATPAPVSRPACRVCWQAVVKLPARSRALTPPAHCCYAMPAVYRHFIPVRSASGG